ncbi:MAG: hypothetical protein LBU47_06400, partial [Christensenellaceae bacterium]|nr:hypothetical protein [Christensenellaceae bacterium]
TLDCFVATRNDETRKSWAASPSLRGAERRGKRNAGKRRRALCGQRRAAIAMSKTKAARAFSALREGAGYFRLLF